MLGEAVGFVANMLEEAEAGVTPGQGQGFRPPGDVGDFLFFGQAHQDLRIGADLLQGFGGGGELAFAAVNQDNIRKNLAGFKHFAVTAADHFGN